MSTRGPAFNRVTQSTSVVSVGIIRNSTQELNGHAHELKMNCRKEFCW